MSVFILHFKTDAVGKSYDQKFFLQSSTISYIRLLHSAHNEKVMKAYFEEKILAICKYFFTLTPPRITVMSYRRHTLKKTKQEITALMRNVLQAVYHFERYKEKYFGITYELYYALTLIHNTKKQTITRLADTMGIPLHKATRIVQRLHAKRLVERKTSVKDKRVVYVVLTQKGKQCLYGIEDFCYNTVMNNVASMSEDEISLLIHAAASIPDILRSKKFHSKEVKYAK